jgi:isopenicillin N synthase-like dioxygenase
MSTTITETSSISPVDPHQYDYERLEKYEHPPETKENLPWAELVTLDLEDFHREGGKERLAKQLEHAVHHVGFFYVKNYGLSQSEVDQQFTLAKNFFALPVDEKAKYECNYRAADYNGWRRNTGPDRGFNHVEVYNIPKFTKDFEGKYQQPDLLKAHLKDIERFSKTLHNNVVIPLLHLFAIILQLPDEEFLAKQHTYDQKSEDHFSKYIFPKQRQLCQISVPQALNDFSSRNLPRRKEILLRFILANLPVN